jgi:hypothetical protein
MERCWLLSLHIRHKRFRCIIKPGTIPKETRRRPRYDDKRSKFTVGQRLQRLLIKFLRHMLDAGMIVEIGNKAAIKKLAFLHTEVPFQRPSPEGPPDGPTIAMRAIQSVFTQQDSGDMCIVSGLMPQTALKKWWKLRSRRPLLLDQFHDLGQTRSKGEVIRAQEKDSDSREDQQHDQQRNQPEQPSDIPPTRELE